MLNVDGWTDGRMDERTNRRKLARLCLPAKAGATKSVCETLSPKYMLSLLKVSNFKMSILTQEQ